MTDDRTNRLRNDANQSSQDDLAFGEDPRDLGAGGQTDQNVGGQQNQQHDVNRDRKLNQAGYDARTPPPKQD